MYFLTVLEAKAVKVGYALGHALVTAQGSLTPSILVVLSVLGLELAPPRDCCLLFLWQPP